MNAATHTPTPWVQRVDAVMGGDEESVFSWARLPAERLANTAFVVRACNSHDELIATALRVIDGATDRMWVGAFGKHLSDLRTALAKAGA